MTAFFHQRSLGALSVMRTDFPRPRPPNAPRYVGFLAVRGTACRVGHDEYASAVRIEPLPERLYAAAIRLWQDSGLARPGGDFEGDLRRAGGGGWCGGLRA